MNLVINKGWLQFSFVPSRFFSGVFIPCTYPSI
uniref:Uncharacterized protein n=1 Tax=Rhizophora mucronata TaxID=61149 RepID=A0A2P2M8G2_RHIMU